MTTTLQSPVAVALAGAQSGALSGDIPPLNWQGAPITEATCSACVHGSLRALGGCEPGRSCMSDVYARRIDRFFTTHPTLAAGHLAHPYFEVRAIAARHVDLFQLAPLLSDPDETVRMQLALRLPQRLLLKLRADPHREVRIRVAMRIELAQLAAMAADTDYQVRCIVARRLPEGALHLLMHDRDLQVRLEVARRVAMPALWGLASDAAPEVRRIVAQRVPAPLLEGMTQDTDWLVRWEAASRAQGAALQRLLADTEPEVRLRAQQRQAGEPDLNEEAAHG